MLNKTTVEFSEKEGILGIKISNYGDIIEGGELTDEFLNNLLEGYEEVEDSERKKRERKLSALRKFRETIRKSKKEYELPVKAIHLYPEKIADFTSEHIRDVIIKSVGFEAEDSRTVADRWELFEDLAVGADLLIDASAIATGLYRYISTGEIREGFAGFGYLAVLGMVLLILYFVLRIKGEEPCKRRNRYLTHILRTPITLHRRYGPQVQTTFYPNSEEIPPGTTQRPQ
jgi:hypothetical protein